VLIGQANPRSTFFAVREVESSPGARPALPWTGPASVRSPSAIGTSPCNRLPYNELYSEASTGETGLATSAFDCSLLAS